VDDPVVELGVRDHLVGIHAQADHAAQSAGQM